MSRLPALDLGDPLLAGQLPGRSLAISAGAGSGKTFALVTLVLGFLGRDGTRAFEVMATTFGRGSAADLKARVLGPLDRLAQWDEAFWNEALISLRDGWAQWDALLKTAEAPDLNEGDRPVASRPSRLSRHPPDDAPTRFAPGDGNPRPPHAPHVVTGQSPATTSSEITLAARQWFRDGRWPLWASSSAKARSHWIRTRREAEGLEVSTVHSVALEVLRRAGEAGAELLPADDPRLEALLRGAGREALELPENHRDFPMARKLLAWLEGDEAGASRWQGMCEAFDAHTDALGGWRENTETEDTAEAFWGAATEWLEGYRPFGATPMRAAKITQQGKPHGSFIRNGLKKIVTAPVMNAPDSEVLRFVEAMARSIPTTEGKIPTQYYAPEFVEAMTPLQEALPGLMEHWLSLLLERVLLRFLALKEARRWLSYGDLVRKALAQVRAVPVPRHPRLLLVDEFQDINPVQAAFLDALGAEATVVVGDPKQAIYGFRGGVADLLRQRIETASAHGLAFRLPRNHRSTAPVVKVANVFVNDIVPLLDAGAADPDGEQSDGGEAGGEALVAVARVDSERPKGADLPAAAAWIAALSREAGWRSLGLTEIACPGPRRRALLLPFRNGLPALRRALQQRGVEPLVQTRDGFWESPGVRLMMALLECLAHPERPLPFLAVLRSSWIGVTDAQLLNFVGRPSEGWENLKGTDWPPRLQSGLQWLRDLRGATVQHVAAAGLSRPGLLECLAATAAHGRLEPERARRNLDQFMGMLTQLASDVPLAFAALDRLRARPKGDAPVDGAAADLLIQTIHASKGLEYEDVLLPMLNDSVKGIRRGEVGRSQLQHLILGWKLGKVQAPEYTKLKQAEDARVRREGLNLLYVALTRARHRMVLLQQWSRDPDTGAFLAPPSASARHADNKSVKWQHIASEFTLFLPDLPQIDAAPIAVSPVVSAALPSLRQAPLHPALTPDSGSEFAIEDSPERSARKRQGTALHGLLREMLMRHAADSQSAEARLREHPVVARWPQAAEQVRRFFTALQEQGWERFPRRTEFPLPDAGSSSAAGFADLVIWEPDRANPDCLHLVDFKLAREFSELEQEAYAIQLEGYRQALARLHPGSEIDTWLYSIEGGRFVKA